MPTLPRRCRPGWPTSAPTCSTWSGHNPASLPARASKRVFAFTDGGTSRAALSLTPMIGTRYWLGARPARSGSPPAGFGSTQASATMEHSPRYSARPLVAAPVDSLHPSKPILERHPRKQRSPCLARVLVRCYTWHERSSRSPRPGSIAAASVSTGHSPGPASSRSPRPGSIAAATPSTASSLSRSGLPGQHDRAPLRRVLDGGLDSLPAASSRSPRPGSIAAICLPRQQLPPEEGSSRSTRPGSIAAGGRPTTATRWRRGLPGQHDRAPLRHGVLADLGGSGGVFPVTTTGLHCGTRNLTEKWRHLRDVFPVTTTGLHCGLSRNAKTAHDLGVFPVTTTGLHCGSRARGRGSSPIRSSRSTRPGSIAVARRRASRSCGRSRSSRSPRPGFIAVPVCRTVTTRSRPVFPVTTTGKTRSIYDAGWARSRSTSSHGVSRRGVGPVGTSEVLLSGSRHESRLRWR